MDTIDSNKILFIEIEEATLFIKREIAGKIGGLSKSIHPIESVLQLVHKKKMQIGSQLPTED